MGSSSRAQNLGPLWIHFFSFSGISIYNSAAVVLFCQEVLMEAETFDGGDLVTKYFPFLSSSRNQSYEPIMTKIIRAKLVSKESILSFFALFFNERTQIAVV